MAASPGRRSTSVRDSPSAELLEPLEVGLRLLLGQEVRVAVEIREVAEDVVKRIRDERAKREAGGGEVSREFLFFRVNRQSSLASAE